MERLELFQSPQILLDPAEVLLDGQLRQLANAVEASCSRQLGSRTQAQIYASVFNLERGPRVLRQPGTLAYGDPLGQITKAPRGETKLFPALGGPLPRLRLPRRCGLRLLQMHAQLVEVATGDLPIARASDLDARPQMRGE